MYRGCCVEDVMWLVAPRLRYSLSLHSVRLELPATRLPPHLCVQLRKLCISGGER